MITLQVTEEELAILREGALALEMHCRALVEGSAAFKGSTAIAFRDSHRAKADAACALYAKLSQASR